MDMMSDERLITFCRSLSDAVRSGLPLSEAFSTLSKSAAHGKIIAGAAKMTADGSSLHEALRAQGIFPPVLIALIRAGEEGGKTEEFLDLFAECLEVRVEFRRRILRALVYPAFAAILAGALFLFFSLKAVPFILGSLLSAGVAIPARTFWLNDMAAKLYNNWPPVIIFICLSALALMALLRSGPGRKLSALAGHWLPVFRFATEQARLYHIYTTMGLLLKAGLPLSAMMDVLQQFAQDDPVTRRRFSRAAAILSDGGSFMEGLGSCMPPEDRHSMEVGEKAGRLDDILLRLGKTHHDLHLHRLKLLVTGFKISAAIALALLSFGLIFTILRPVLSSVAVALNGSFSARPLTGAAAPPGPAPSSKPAGAGRLLPDPSAVTDQTGLFNTSQGRKIAELMKKSGQKGPATPEDGARTQTEAQEKQVPKTKKRLLGPAAPIKTLKFQKINPTPVTPTN